MRKFSHSALNISNIRIKLANIFLWGSNFIILFIIIFLSPENLVTHMLHHNHILMLKFRYLYIYNKQKMGQTNKGTRPGSF